MINTDESKIYEDYRLCPNCGKKVLATNSFCTYCGSSVEGTENSTDPDNASPNAISEQSYSPVVDDHSKKKSASGKGNRIAIILLSIVLAAALAGNIYEYLTIEKKDGIISEIQYDLEQSEKEVTSLNKEVSSLNKKVSSLNSEIDALEPKAEYYDEICKFLTNSDAGYANGNFKCSEKIIFLKYGGKSQSVTLTTGYTGTYSYRCTGNSASGNFKYSSWSGSSTTFTFTSKYATGITIFTFSNNVNSQTFRVMVVVYN